MSLPPALLFDAYGTMFDVQSVTAALNAHFPGKGAQLAQSWRTKQLEYTWQRTLMGRYADFEAVTAESLRYACALHQCEYSQALWATLRERYGRLATFPEVPATLAALRERGVRLGILSNGSPAMLDELIAHHRLTDTFEAVISVDPLRRYKPDPAVYQLAVDRLKLGSDGIGFVSANGWDASGAKSFGFRVFWINRGGLPAETSGFAPDHVLGDLSGLL
ncbi:MAG: haloacid dehalogenase type II [Betaproteobacteria bacterium]|nr:haloacid dehalogenase type II [Betaproteobacteria bacterium]